MLTRLVALLTRTAWTACLGFVALATVYATSVAAQSSEESKSVLILFTHQADQPAQAIVEKALRFSLQAKSGVNLEIYSEYLDAVRTPLDNFENDLVRQYQHKYAGKKFDLIFAVNPPALKFSLKNRSALAPDAPIVFLVLDQPSVAGLGAAPNVTGVWGEVNYAANLELALSLHPGTEHVVVISGVGEWDNYWRSVVQEQLRPFDGRVDISYLTGLTIREQKEALSALPPHTIVLFVSSTRDKAGNNPGNLEVLRQICPASNAPVYGNSDAQLGLGIVGGHLLSFEALGIAGAQAGARVLAGEKPEAIPSHGIPTVPMFDWRELQRWGIPEETLPAGSVVQYKELSAWEQYKWYVIGFSSLLAVETLLIGLLIYLRLRRRQAEAEAARVSGRLSEIVANVPGIVWETRTIPGSEKRRTTFISEYVERMLGYTPDEWMKQPPGFGLRIVAEEDKERANRESEEAARNGKDNVSEYRWLTKDGRIRWVENYLSPVLDENARIVGLRGVALDVTNRKLAEAKALEAEEKDKAILAAIPDLMFLQSLDGVYLDYHATDPKDLLVPPEAFLGKNLREVLPSDLAEQIINCFARAEEGGEPQIFEYKLNLTGEDRWFEARMVRTGDNIISIVRDISDRIRALESLLRSEERFSKAFRSSPQPMSITTITDGRYVDVNESFLMMSGYTRNEVIGHTSLELGIWETPEVRAEFMKAVLKNSSVFNAETRFHTKDGTVRTLLSSAERLDIGGEDCVLIASSDITDRIKDQAALRESERRLRIAQHAARVGTWEWDIETGRSVWSEMIWELLGIEQGDAEVTVDRFASFIHPDDRERVWDNVNDVIANGEEYYDEFRLVRKDGSVLWVASQGRLSRFPNGQPERMLGVNIDITERKAADEALREREERFRNMAESAPVMIWMTDDKQNTTYVNKQWLELTGSTVEKESGFGWATHVHPDDMDASVGRYTAAFEKKVPFELEFRVLRFDGEYRWVYSSGTPRFTHDGEFVGYIGTAFDISERKEAERELREALDELKVLKSQLEAENIYLHQELQQDHAFGDIIGQSSAIKYVLFKVSQVAPIDSTVLITGETGTGKELVARAIHEASKRNDRPLIKVNCAALTPSLIESELFGHEKGSFTGAAGRKIGRFELANRGTLLLDEIGELPLDLQAKLLRVLQEGEFERVGSGNTIKADVRVIALTNRDLKQEVEKGKFREDLWYRLNVFPITTPPLRDRRDDIPLLTDHFTKIFSRKFGKDLNAVAPDSMKALCDYSWPGNVRELANVIERAVINARSRILRISEDFSIRTPEAMAASVRTLEELERDHITEVLQDTRWRIDGQRGAAVLLGINPSTLRTRMAKLGITKPKTNGKPTNY